MTALEQAKRYTADEYLAMTGLEGSYELWDGYIYDMSPAPSPMHQDIALTIARQIADYIDANKGKCKVYVAPLDVKLSENDVVQPDVFVICDRDKIGDKYCNGAPDWVIEVLSPSNGKHDTIGKLYKYFQFGVREYWVVDPDEKKVVVYPFGTTKITGFFTFDDDIPVGIYRDAPVPLNIHIGEI